LTGIIKRISPVSLQLQSYDGEIHNVVSGEIIL